MTLRWRPRKRAVIVGLAGVALLAGVIALAAVLHQPVALGVRNLRIPVVDGPRDNQRVVLDATFFTPAGQGRVPAILLAPGFGETKEAVQPQAEYLARAGFAVLTWSPRGTGASTGQIALNSPDYEIKDTEQLVGWLARQPRVLLDHPGDPRVGIAGASYGGGLALLAAAYDHRIDAVVAQSAWNNLATALFPNAVGGGPATGVFKKQWAGLLFTQGSAGFGTPLPGQGGTSGISTSGSSTSSGSPAGALASRVLCGRFLPGICAMYQQIAQTGQATPGAISLLQRSSPASVADRMDAPSLLIQGEHDSLFDLGQANANYQAIRRNGAPADMVWFAGGHDGGDQETSRVNSLMAAWFERWLAPGHPPASAATGQPGFAVTRVLGFDPSTDGATLGVATAASYPGLAGTQRTLVRLAGPPQAIAHPAGGSPPSMSVFPGLGAFGAAGAGGPAGPTFDMPGQSAAFTSAPLASSLQVTGSPTVRIRVSGPGEVTLFAKVYDVDQGGNATLPYQLAAPLRVSGARAGRTIAVALPAIDYSFSAGHRLRLVLTTTDFSYATAPAPAVYRVALAGRGLTAPSDPALTVIGAGAPWWVWAAPTAALVAAALILMLRRRRGRDGLVPGPRRRSAGDLGTDQALPGRAARRGRPVAAGGPRPDTRAARAERRREDHDAAGPDGPAAPGRGHDHDLRLPGAPRVAGAVPAGLVRRGTRLPAAPVRPGQPGAVLAGHRPAGRRRPPGRGADDRGPWRGHRPPGPRLLPRHVPAPGHRPGHARAAGPAGARRAYERPRSAADQGDARGAARLRGRRAHRHPVQPPARRGRADLQPRGRDEPGQADRRGPVADIIGEGRPCWWAPPRWTARCRCCAA